MVPSLVWTEPGWSWAQSKRPWLLSIFSHRRIMERTAILHWETIETLTEASLGRLWLQNEQCLNEFVRGPQDHLYPLTPPAAACHQDGHDITSKEAPRLQEGITLRTLMLKKGLWFSTRWEVRTQLCPSLSSEHRLELKNSLGQVFRVCKASRKISV